MINTDAMANDGQRREVLLAQIGSGIWQGPRVGRPAQGRPDGGGGSVGDVGAGDRASAGRTALGTLGRGTVGRDWHYTSARRWCHSE